MEVVKAMIHDQDLPIYLWVEAAKTTTYIQNKLSHSALGNKTPKETFTSGKPEVSHPKIFGCPIYLHVPKEKRSKLDPLGKKEYRLDIVISRKHTESMFQVFVKLRSTEMSHLMKMQHSTNL